MRFEESQPQPSGQSSARAKARILVVGVGGIGSPAALILARAGIGTLGLVDDDRVERTNLHRQLLFADTDVASEKLDAAARGLGRLSGPFPPPRLELHRTRFVPENAESLARSYDLIVEGADNFPTKFLVADAARVVERPVVHAAAVRTHGTVLSVGPRGGPCYRCLFEDIPREDVANCEAAGVVGPLLGLVAAVQADLALSIIDAGVHASMRNEADSHRLGTLVRIDATAFRPRLRSTTIRSRRGCSLCGEGARPSVAARRYDPVPCGIAPETNDTDACP